MNHQVWSMPANTRNKGRDGRLRIGQRAMNIGVNQRTPRLADKSGFLQRASRSTVSEPGGVAGQWSMTTQTEASEQNGSEDPARAQAPREATAHAGLPPGSRP